VPIIISATSGFSGAFFVDAGASHTYVLTRAAEAGGVGGGDERSASVSRAYRSLEEAMSVDALHVLAAPKSFATPLALAWAALWSGAAGGGGGGGEAGGVGGAKANTLEASGGGGAAAAAASAFDSVVQSINAELSPVAAVVGGVLVNEALKIVTGKDEPLSNFFVFDGMGGGGGRVWEL
jgi:hypothetical protein